MAYSRRTTGKDATWSRAWTCATLTDLAQLATDALPLRGDVAFVTANAQYYLWMDDGTWRVLPMSTFGQIPFPATQIASSDANTLDDYEEGTWTPVLSGDGGTSGQTYASQAGTYVKIGKMVIGTFAFTLTAKGTITGFCQISGFPFATENVTNLRPTANVIWDSMAVAKVFTGLIFSVNASAHYLGGLAAASVSGAGTSYTTTDISNSTSFFGTFAYTTP